MLIYGNLYCIRRFRQFNAAKTKSCQMDMVLSQFHPIAILTTYLISFHLFLDLPNVLIQRGVPIKIICVFLVSPILAKYSAHHSYLNFRIFTILCN
jgi:hypothetical protein